MDWLDLARYADTYGYQADVERDMSPWRDWVIRAFNQNLPYDQFLTWQLAGDLLPDATDEQRLATAFNRLHRQTNEGGSIEEEFRIEYVADRVHTFGTAFLGLTLECARCHDHKFDPITQRDYYALGAFFNNIDESGLYSHFTNATPTPTLLLWPAAPARAARGGAGADRGGRSRGCTTIAAGLAPGLPRVAGHGPRDAADAGGAPGLQRASRGTALPDRVGARRARRSRTARCPSPTPPLLAGADGALQFSGDNAVVHPGVPTFRRAPPVLDRPVAAADRAPGPRGRAPPVAVLDRRRQRAGTSSARGGTPASSP